MAMQTQERQSIGHPLTIGRRQLIVPQRISTAIDPIRRHARTLQCRHAPTARQLLALPMVAVRIPAVVEAILDRAAAVGDHTQVVAVVIQAVEADIHIAEI